MYFKKRTVTNNLLKQNHITIKLCRLLVASKGAVVIGCFYNIFMVVRRSKVLTKNDAKW